MTTNSEEETTIMDERIDSTNRTSMRRMTNLLQDEVNNNDEEDDDTNNDRPTPSAPSYPIYQEVQILSSITNEPLFPCHITERSNNSNAPRQYGRRQLSNRNRRSNVSDVSVPITNETRRSADTNNTISNDANNRLRAYELALQHLEHPLGTWNNGMSSMLACLGTTLGLFNISRFAILSIQFGANFIVQFIILSLVVGIPLFSFHVSLGQLLCKGPVQMWKISPIFRGIGIAILLSQIMIGIYSSIGLTWMLVYLKDSFITNKDVFRWAMPVVYHRYRGGELEDVYTNIPYNVTFNIKETTADYFNGVVLQRYGTLSSDNQEHHHMTSVTSSISSINYSLAFNSAIVWLIVCMSLRKGLNMYGKVIFLYTMTPIIGLFVFCVKLLRLTNLSTIIQDSGGIETDWTEFFLNTKSWTAAFSESFYTWGLLGAASMQITAHNRYKHTLHKDVLLVALLTFAVLILAGFLGNICVHLLLSQGYFYVPSSFERTSTAQFLQPKSSALSPNLVFTPVRWMKHSSLLLGERTNKAGSNTKLESGYQVLRLATELVPATFAAFGSAKISPFWSVLFYFSLILIGLAQQLAIWHLIVSSIGSIDKTKTEKYYYILTVFTCLIAFLMSLPLTTESGIYIVYFLDYTIGAGWWIVLLYFLEISALFMVRGRPYSGETVVATLFSQSNKFLQNWIAPLLSFDWNVILPVTLLFLASSMFRSGGHRHLYNWSTTLSYEYWPLQNREMGAMIQLIPLLLVFIVAVIQTFRYMSSGPVDIFDRLQLLYRPTIQTETSEGIFENSSSVWPESTRARPTEAAAATVVEDSPPKYTPPPSYSTATGARIAKALRQSFRRSMRRARAALNIPETTTTATTTTVPVIETPPPEYSITLEDTNPEEVIHFNERSVDIPSSVGNNSNESSVDNESSVGNNFNEINIDNQSSNIVEEEQQQLGIVALIRRSLSSHSRRSLRSSHSASGDSTSIECLVENIAPIFQETTDIHLQNEDIIITDNETEKKDSEV